MCLSQACHALHIQPPAPPAAHTASSGNTSVDISEGSDGFHWIDPKPPKAKALEQLSLEEQQAKLLQQLQWQLTNQQHEPAAEAAVALDGFGGSHPDGSGGSHPDGTGATRAGRKQQQQQPEFRPLLVGPEVCLHDFHLSATA